MPAAARIGDSVSPDYDSGGGSEQPQIITAGSSSVFIGDGPYSVTTIAIPADPNPIPMNATELAYVEKVRPLALADAANQEVHVTAAEAPERANAQTVAGEPTGTKLDENLRSAQTKYWKESGSNPNILACYSAVGCPTSTDSVAWCAAFAGAMLKASGLAYKKSLSSLNYQGYGTAVPINDPTKWRKNDIVVFKRTGGGHIGFIQAVSPTQQKLSVLGGNQSDNLTITNFGPAYFSNIVWIGRAESDVPNVSIVTNSLGAVGSTRVT